jgi:hypothetical protein
LFRGGCRVAGWGGPPAGDRRGVGRPGRHEPGGMSSLAGQGWPPAGRGLPLAWRGRVRAGCGSGVGGEKRSYGRHVPEGAVSVEGKERRVVGDFVGKN